jgi:hypothetical protein
MRRGRSGVTSDNGTALTDLISWVVHDGVALIGALVLLPGLDSAR